MKKLLFVSFFLFCFFFSRTICSASLPPFYYFHPPKDWLISDPTHLPKEVKIAFIQSERKMITPSINLTLEKVDVPIETYIQEVKKIHQTDRTTQCRELGILNTKSGNAHLLEISMKKEWGDIRILQSILIKDGFAHLLTALSLKKDFMKYHELFLSTFKSLTIAPDLYSSITEEEPRKVLKEKIHSLRSLQEEEQLRSLLSFMDTSLEKEGKCWQILAIQYIKNNLKLLQGCN